MIKPRFAATTLGGAALAAAMLGAGTASAAAPAVPHTISMTQLQHGSFIDDQGFNPCTGDPLVLSFTGNQVNHVTFFPASNEVWATFTEEGAATTSDNGVDYSGRATGWGNFNLNNQNGVSGFTMTIHLTGSDGSVVVAHIVSQDMLDSNGNVITSWFKAPVLTCG
jgi:hypothetical protein